MATCHDPHKGCGSFLLPPLAHGGTTNDRTLFLSSRDRWLLVLFSVQSNRSFLFMNHLANVLISVSTDIPYSLLMISVKMIKYFVFFFFTLKMCYPSSFKVHFFLTIHSI